MRKMTAVLLCVFLLTMLSVTAFAAAPQTFSGQTVITTTVPYNHKVVIHITGNANVTLDGEPGEEHIVDRMSQPVLDIIPNDGEKVTKVLLNGVDITDQVNDGEYVLLPVYQDEDLDFQVETKKTEQSDTSKLESSVPDTSKPESSKSGTSKPEGSVPDTSKPVSSVPDSSKPTPGTDTAKTGDYSPTIALSVIGIISILTAALLYRSKKEKD